MDGACLSSPRERSRPPGRAEEADLWEKVPPANGETKRLDDIYLVVSEIQQSITTKPKAQVP
jgi:hypothetical protein